MEVYEGREHEHQEAVKIKSPAHFLADLSRVSTRVSTSSNARFGNLSHHSFFSRHNPHPHRVRHISGLNGSPVCIVNDDWYNNTPLYPHPLIRSQMSSSTKQTMPPLPYQLTYRAEGAKQESALVSEAWREELKDLATKVSLQAAGQSKRKEEVIREEEPPRRKTQYSSETGRIIPPSSWRSKRRDAQTSLTRPGTYRPASLVHPGSYSLGGQELRVLELLCQILQTDSLSLVQQWLLLAGDREKEMVLGMLQQAMADSPNLIQQHQFPITAPPDPLQTCHKRKIRSLGSATDSIKERPERIGEAEVLRVEQDDNQYTDDTARRLEHSG
ncbi:protein TBATA [Trichomycterus rosablanca]|uniref:protein TBATA n=1 Tax=Trichomycterus rosablanca TaxID=2290929 RepID=UPI002F34FE44